MTERTRFNRITFDSNVMGGRACIRGLRITVGSVVSLVAEGRDNADILGDYPDLEEADIRQALAYAAWSFTCATRVSAVSATKPCSARQ